MEQVPAVKLLERRGSGRQSNRRHGPFSLKLIPDTPINIISEISFERRVLPVGTVTDLLAEDSVPAQCGACCAPCTQVR